MKEKINDKMYHFKYSIFHPFDGFYEIRFRNHGSILLAVILMAVCGILRCIEFQYTGFIINTNQLETMNSLSIFAGTIAVFILFCVSNWSVTTLLNGNGNLKAIMIVLGYSLTPYMMGDIIKIFMSNFVIMEEVMIINVIFVIGIIWSVFMLLCGLLTVHEYTFGKNFAAVLLTFVAAIIIVFIGMLIFTLVEQMVGFIADAGKEIIRRM